MMPRYLTYSKTPTSRVDPIQYTKSNLITSFNCHLLVLWRTKKALPISLETSYPTNLQHLLFLHGDQLLRSLKYKGYHTWRHCRNKFPCKGNVNLAYSKWGFIVCKSTCVLPCIDGANLTSFRWGSCHVLVLIHVMSVYVGVCILMGNTYSCMCPRICEKMGFVLVFHL